MSLNLPKILEPLREKIEATLTQTVRISPRNEAPVHLWQSKIGGKPYWPKNLDYPQNSEGSFLFFLAQFNFSEVPALPGFPSRGLLQFYIASDGMYGLDFDEPKRQNGFRVVYHEAISQEAEYLESDFTFLPDFEDVPLSSNVSLALDFSLEEEYLGPPDYRFDQVHPAETLAQFGDDEEEIMDFFYELGSKASGHKLGGYAFFTQYDPRDPAENLQLLFQMDSDNKINCMWGDMGIANFFISFEDLQAKRFDRVLYNWDCA